MGSTNKTAHYELPQFVANDKPSWLGDVNEAMEAIDAGIYGAKSSADGAQQTANNAVAGVASAGTRMDGIQTQLDTVATQANQTATTVAGHTSSIATNSANINTLNSRMGSTDISAIGDGTVTGAISAISGGGAGGSVSAVASGDTYRTLLNKLYALIDFDKVNGNSKVQLGAEIYHIVAYNNDRIIASVTRADTTGVHAKEVTINASTSEAYEATGTTGTNITQVSVGNGTEITLFY